MTRLSLLMAAALAGCATAAPAPEHAAPAVCSYFPLAVGNSWTYDGPPGPDGKAEPITIAITGNRDGFFQQTGDQLIRCDAEGLHDQKRLLLQGPLERGHTWKSVVSVGSVEEYQVIDVGSTVNVPAGSFANTVTTLAKQRIDEKRTLLNETTFAQGVGMIRVATRLQEGSQTIPQIEIVLRSFDPAPKASAP